MIKAKRIFKSKLSIFDLIVYFTKLPEKICNNIIIETTTDGIYINEGISNLITSNKNTEIYKINDTELIYRAYINYDYNYTILKLVDSPEYERYLKIYKLVYRI